MLHAIYLSIYQSIYLSIHLSIYLSITTTTFGCETDVDKRGDQPPSLVAPRESSPNNATGWGLESSDSVNRNAVEKWLKKRWFMVDITWYFTNYSIHRDVFIVFKPTYHHISMISPLTMGFPWCHGLFQPTFTSRLGAVPSCTAIGDFLLI